MWLCWLPVLMDALTSVSQHCGGHGEEILVSQCDFPLQSSNATGVEAASHTCTSTERGGAFENLYSSEPIYSAATCVAVPT